MVLLHANAVPQNGALGIGTAGVNSNNADAFAIGARHFSEAIDQRALAGAGRTRNADG